MNTRIRLHTAEVAGSNPASPTQQKTCFADKTRDEAEISGFLRRPCAATQTDILGPAPNSYCTSCCRILRHAGGKKLSFPLETTTTGIPVAFFVRIVLTTTSMRYPPCHNLLRICTCIDSTGGLWTTKKGICAGWR